MLAQCRARDDDRNASRKPDTMTNKGHWATLSAYARGRTSVFASRLDQRMSYCCYIPASYTETGDRRYPLAVLVHGSLRDATGLRDQFIDFAEAAQCALLAPLFPCGIVEPGDLHNYKRMLYEGIRYDRVLLDMIAEIGETYRLHTDRVLMHGFSGGGQFAHRFLYLHPERLMGVSIGAPGVVTLPDPDKPWWVGTGGLEAIFGRRLDLDAMRKVPVEMVVGAQDVETWDVTVKPSSPNWMEGVNDTGETRIDRLRSLERAFLAQGISVRFDVVPDVEHAGGLVQEPVKAFFSDVLAGRGLAPST